MTALAKLLPKNQIVAPKFDARVAKIIQLLDKCWCSFVKLTSFENCADKETESDRGNDV